MEAGTRAVLASYSEAGQLLSCSTTCWGTSPVLELPLPQNPQANGLHLFYLDDGAPLRTSNDLTALLPQTA